MDRQGQPRRLWLMLAMGALLLSFAIYQLGQASNRTSPSSSADLSSYIEASPTARVPTPAATTTTEPLPTASAIPAPTVSSLPPTGLLVVTDAKDQSVTLVDAASGQVTKTVRVGVRAGEVAIGPDGRTAWVFSGQSGGGDFQLVDVETGKPQKSKRLRSWPGAVAFSTDGSRAYVALYGGNGVSFLNSTSLNEFGSIELGRQTQGVQMRRQPRSPVVVKTAAGEVLFVAGMGSGVVWALDAGSGEVIAEIEVGGAPEFLLPGPGGQRIYAVVGSLNQLVEIDAATHKVAGRHSLPGRPSAAAIGPKGGIYVSSEDADEVWAFDPSARTTWSSIRVGARPAGVAFSADGSRAYVSNRGDGTISVVDVATRQVVGTIQVGGEPKGIAFAAPLSESAGSEHQPSDAGGSSSTGTPAVLSPTPTVVPAPTPLPPGAQPPEKLPSGTVKETFLADAEFAVSLAFAPDGRLFYAELRTGRIRIVENGTLLPDPFYELAVAGQPETGLLCVILDPDFANNHYVYVFYTSVADGGQTGGSNGPNQVVRLTEVGGKGTDLTPILSDLPSGPIHNAGGMRFGPDGKLYVSLGNNDHDERSQDLGSVAGKILRVNPDGSIPDDNPFVGQPGKRPEIWAYGLRNSFRFDFHPTGHGLFAGENGPGDNDEINIIVKGGNYGWPPSGYQDKPGLVDPIAVMNPTIAPTGFAFYVGDQIPEWRDELLYCDFNLGQLRRIHVAPESFDRIVYEEMVTRGCMLDVETGPDGALYFSDVNGIYRIRRADAAALPAVILLSDKPIGPPVVTP